MNNLNESISYGPLLQKRIIKKIYKNGEKTIKERIVYCITNKNDEAIYKKYSKLISKEYEKYAMINNIDDCVIAYRNKAKTNIDLAFEVFEEITKYKSCVIYISDFHHFFDEINHQKLKKNLCKIYGSTNLKKEIFNLYKNITKYHYINKDGKRKIKVNENTKGVPQGICLSGIISNVYMSEVDIEVNNYVKEINGIYRRFSDDIIIIIPSNSEKLNSHLDNIRMILTKSLIDINQNKEHIYMYCNNNIVNNDNILNKKQSKNVLEYLGFAFDGRMVKIKDATMNRHYRKMTSKIKNIIKNPITYKGNKVTNEVLYKIYSSKPLYRQNLAFYEMMAENKFKKLDAIKFISHRKKFDLKIKRKLQKKEK